MKRKPTATIPALVLASLFAGSAFGQSVETEGLAAGTQYTLLGTDSVAFGPGIQRQTRKELLFKFSADAKSRDGAEATESDKRSWSGDLAFDRIDFLQPGEVRMYDVVDGLSYSAGIDVKKTRDFDSQSEIISSRQLGIHYGRLGPENYSSVDLSIRQFNQDTTSREDADDKELWSLGVTTGRRFALTGLDEGDPLWTVSLRGQFDVSDSDNLDEALDNQQWYVSPGLQWRGDSFRLTADVLMPFMQAGELEEESDYRVRAKIEKRF